MAKRCCGRGGRETKVLAESLKQGGPNAETVMMRYTGTAKNRRRAKAPFSKLDYTYSADEPEFLVTRLDAEQLELITEFEIVPQIKTGILNSPTLTVDREVPRMTPIESLDVRGETLTMLKQGGVLFVEDLRNLTNAQILSIKGVGNARLSEIRGAVELLV